MYVGVSMSTMRLLKSVTGLLPKSAHSMGHRPPLDFCSCWSSSLNTLLWRLVRSFAVNLQPPSICVFVSGDWHLVHMRWAAFSFTSVDVYSASHLQ